MSDFHNTYCCSFQTAAHSPDQSWALNRSPNSEKSHTHLLDRLGLRLCTCLCNLMVRLISSSAFYSLAIWYSRVSLMEVWHFIADKYNLSDIDISILLHRAVKVFGPQSSELSGNDNNPRSNTFQITYCKIIQALLMLMKHDDKNNKLRYE